MARSRPDVRTLVALAVGKTVELLVYCPHAVFPYLVFPFRRRQLVLEYALVSVECYHLAGLLLHGHLAEQVGNAVFYVGFGIFVDILASVLVVVNPPFLVNLVLGVLVGDEFLAFGHMPLVFLCKGGGAGKQCPSRKYECFHVGV